MNIKKRPEKMVLEQWYCIEKRTTKWIATKCHTTTSRVCKWLRLYEISNRGSERQARLQTLTKKQLETWYWIEKKTTVEIAEMLNTTHVTVRHLLTRHGIAIRSNSEAQKLEAGTDNIQDSILREMYQSGKIQREIGELVGLTQGAVGARLRKIGITGIKSHAGAKNGMYGRTHTAEARAKIRAATVKQFSDPAARERHAQLTCKQIQDGKTGKAYNKLENRVAEIFDNQGKKYIRQYRIGRFLFDFFLPDENTLVEVHGTFWHADPRKYRHDKLSPIQCRNVVNDKKKADRAAQDGYNLKIIWEMDVPTTSKVIGIIPDETGGAYAP